MQSIDKLKERLIYQMFCNGYHEKQKTTFDEVFKTWKYAIRGKTLDNTDIRIIIAFSDDGMLIITVIRISNNRE